ncbi:hypothetical protein [Lentzea aerocolonigenes]|uniref:hypothetical protein n=1 Tax=Lentzea aerocolonigenes TaxID=68170 RepID=UPI000A98A8DB|nr:hypothetical protein [Lentzea aerocolonigenes]
MITEPDQNSTRWVPVEGIHLITGGDGRNPHVVVADPGTCRWSPLLHPEHGDTGIAPGQ